jgi:hypothetical protein
MEYQIYDIKNKEVIIQQIKKLQPLGYNKFRWWINFTQPIQPLLPNAPLLSKIKNGDLEFSHYFWQAQYVEIAINKKYQKLKNLENLLEETQLDRAKRKRLYEEFEKDERNKLNFIKKDFIKEFYISESQFDNEISEFDGTLEEFYYFCSEKFIKKTRIKSKRGRPKKINK